jgi:hypothetical protein
VVRGVSLVAQDPVFGRTGQWMPAIVRGSEAISDTQCSYRRTERVGTNSRVFCEERNTTRRKLCTVDFWFPMRILGRREGGKFDAQLLKRLGWTVKPDRQTRVVWDFGSELLLRPVSRKAFI